MKSKVLREIRVRGRSRAVVTTLFFSVGLVGLASGTVPAEANEPIAMLQCSRDLGPQAPRDLSVIVAGANPAKPLEKAPPPEQMSLCNIHFHKYAEHKAPGYLTAFGTGPDAGFVCEERPTPKPTQMKDGKLGAAAEAPCQSVAENDTIEVHWVFTSCPVPATPHLEGLANPTLRVEAKAFHVEDEGEGEDFAMFDLATDKAQPKSLPDAKGAIEYQGSTTGNSYNNDTNCSSARVTWNVRLACMPLKLSSLKSWCANNAYNEHSIHGVRPLVIKPELLSVIKE